MTRPTVQARRAVATVACAAFAFSLGSCGGGDDSAQPGAGTAAPAAVPQMPTVRALSADKKPKAKPHDRKGVTAIAVAPDGSSIGIALDDGAVQLLDPSSKANKRGLQEVGGSPAAGLMFSADGTKLLSAGRDSVVKFWSVSGSGLPLILSGHEGALRAVTASAGKTLVAAAGEETRVMLWDGSTGRLLRVLRGATDFVNALSLTADGARLAGGGADARIQLWDTASGKLQTTLLGHAGGLNAVVFSPDGKLLASAGEDGKVILWDAVVGQQLHALSGHHASVRALAFSADGKGLAGGAEDGTVTVWDVASRALTQEVAAPGTTINAIAFDTLDPDQLFVGDDQGQVVSIKVKRSKT